MWIASLFLCMAASAFCRAQVTNNDDYTVTETARTRQEVEWDTTGPSVTPSIRDGHSGIRNKSQNELSSYSPFYSNQWQPFLAPIGFDNNGDVNNRLSSEYDNNADYRFTPTFLRRPDSNLNRTSQTQYTQSPNIFRHPFASLPMAPVPMPMAPIPMSMVPYPMPTAPINPMLFYPHTPDSFPSENYQGSDISNLSQNSSAPITTTAVSASEETNYKNVQESIVPHSFAPSSGILEMFLPSDIFRNRDGVVSSPSSAFFTYPIAPNAYGNIFNPAILPFLNRYFYDRNRNLEVTESIPSKPKISETELATTSKNTYQHETIDDNVRPSDTSSAFVPPEPSTLPLAAFPFGVLPPPIYDSIISRPATPLTPVPDSVSLPKETSLQDAILQPPVPGNSSPLGTSPGILLFPNTLKPEEKQPEIVETIVERTVSNAKPSGIKLIPYEFGFDMNDGKGTDQHRKEVSDLSGTVRGSYGYRDLFGVYRFVNYIADKNGFRAFIKSNEPGVASSGSAGVVVLAEEPPIQAIAEDEKISDSVILPNTSTDLTAESSNA